MMAFGINCFTPFTTFAGINDCQHSLAEEQGTHHSVPVRRSSVLSFNTPESRASKAGGGHIGSAASEVYP